MNPFSPVLSIHRLMADYPHLWGFCGGWAIDLVVERQTRPHKDVDIAVLRRDQRALYDYLSTRGWRLETAHEGTLTPWDGVPLDLPTHTLWCRRPQHEPDFLEVLFNEDDGTHLCFRRDLSIRLPLDDAFLRTPDGLPILAPEIVLLYKAKYSHEANHKADFANALPHLDARQRAWLGAALSTLYEAHDWAKTLAACRLRADIRR